MSSEIIDFMLSKFLPPLSVVASIGISDMIEYYISPRVHQIHNCPDIMDMNWSDYGGWHAFLSGVKCAWFLIMPTCLFRHNWMVITGLNIANICIPIMSYLSGKDKEDPYYAHKMLYMVNPILIAMSILMGFL